MESIDQSFANGGYFLKYKFQSEPQSGITLSGAHAYRIRWRTESEHVLKFIHKIWRQQNQVNYLLLF